MLFALSPGALPSELLIAQHMPYDGGDEADHSRAILDDAHRMCEERGLRGKDLLSTLPLQAVKLWREKPIQRGGEDYIPDVVVPQLTATLQSGVVEALVHRERWRAEITGFMLMVVNGNRAERAVAFSATILAGHVRRWWLLDEAGQRYFRD